MMPSSAQPPAVYGVNNSLQASESTLFIATEDKDGVINDAIA